MTSSWLEVHASYIESFHKATAHQLTLKTGSTIGQDLNVPMIPTGLCKDSTSLTVDITVAHNFTIVRGHDSDIKYDVSDGTKFIGFQTVDKGNYGDHSPCYGVEGLSGPSLTFIRRESVTSKPRQSFYPGQFVFTLKLDERWGSCYTAHDGGFVRNAGYNNPID